ncbi:2,4-dienoyl-CoA reductase [Pilibacter termitis]|uniref:2,4-dienoyl-CoA reductase n=1 Tax=Pilibacter termitis TaxID=263852 RepID=A0A1T4Q474_9ENTE|nr:NADH:flavin oxidoreductase/NADH oxidase [Pilibacter termitis]SJZ98582.1 2,4-dienoyl-CoA reductase [Pilibacter termitis]
MELFEEVKIKQMKMKNRVFMAPMCQYMVGNEDGCVNDWHETHYVSRAVGGVGAIILEACAISPVGRISKNDLGLWQDEQIAPLANLVEKIHRHDTKVGIQIAHAGRKAKGGGVAVAPSAIAFSENYQTPNALTTLEVKEIIEQFTLAVHRAVTAGVDFIELHAAHGYLIHQFLSPLSNTRTDEYGKGERFLLEIIERVKKIMPDEIPLFLRVSAVEYAESGYTLDDLLPILKKCKTAGVDVLHVSSGGESEIAPPAIYAGYQVKFAETIKNAINLPTIAVGILGNPEIANAVIESAASDFIALGRPLLTSPYWCLHAKAELTGEIDLPKPYERAVIRGKIMK